MRCVEILPQFFCLVQKSKGVTCDPLFIRTCHVRHSHCDIIRINCREQRTRAQLTFKDNNHVEISYYTTLFQFNFGPASLPLAGRLLRSIGIEINFWSPFNWFLKIFFSLSRLESVLRRVGDCVVVSAKIKWVVNTILGLWMVKRLVGCILLVLMWWIRKITSQMN